MYTSTFSTSDLIQSVVHLDQTDHDNNHLSRPLTSDDRYTDFILTIISNNLYKAGEYNLGIKLCYVDVSSLSNTIEELPTNDPAILEIEEEMDGTLSDICKTERGKMQTFRMLQDERPTKHMIALENKLGGYSCLSSSYSCLPSTSSSLLFLVIHSITT